jgi:hypothetical protein
MGASDERVEGEGQRRRRGSLVRLLVGVVARPRATMRAVCGERRRAWWLPALLVLALTVAPAIAQGPLVARTTRQRAVEAREESAELRGQRFTDEERAEVERAVARPLITTVLPAVSRGLRVAVVEWLAWAGLLYLASIALGSHRPFGAMLRVAI